MGKLESPPTNVIIFSPVVHNLWFPGCEICMLYMLYALHSPESIECRKSAKKKGDLQDSMEYDKEEKS